MNASHATAAELHLSVVRVSAEHPAGKWYVPDPCTDGQKSDEQFSKVTLNARLSETDLINSTG